MLASQARRGSVSGPHLHPWSQLIEDKKALGEKCEALVAELKQGDQRRKDREAQMQEQHELVSPLLSCLLTPDPVCLHGEAWACTPRPEPSRGPAGRGQPGTMLCPLLPLELLPATPRVPDPGAGPRGLCDPSRVPEEEVMAPALDPGQRDRLPSDKCCSPGASCFARGHC